MTNLLDSLGVLIGFTTVMLLLSLVVMGIVQFIQHIINLRGNNLQWGLARTFELVLRPTESELNSAYKEIKVANRNAQKKKQAKEQIKSLEEEASIAETRACDLAERILALPMIKTKPNNRMLSLITKSDKTTWIELDEIFDRLKMIGESLTAEQEQKLKNQFPHQEKYISKSFGLNIQFFTVLTSLLVAFYFQVNSFDLMRSLSTDPQFRAKLVDTGQQLIDRAPASLQALSAYENVSEEALSRLQKNFPDLSDQIEEASGFGDTKEEIVAEVNLILSEEAPQRQIEVVAAYETILQDLHQEKAESALRETRLNIATLATVNIIPWQYGGKYYFNFANIVGVLVTGIFLSFGAPFWFDRLRDLVKLRDALQPPSPKDDET